MRAMMELHGKHRDSDCKEIYSSFWVNIDSINGIESAYNGQGSCLYIWPCLKEVKESPKEIVDKIHELIQNLEKDNDDEYLDE